MSRSRNAPARGQGAAKARQMGLLLDLDGGADLGGDDGALEAELLSLVGDGGQPGGKKNGGRAPVPMEDIERMAALCMKDLDEDEEGDDDGDLESDADLLAELNDVLDDNEEEEKPVSPPQTKAPAPSGAPPPGGSGGLESRLVERIDMYQAAIGNAKAAGESSKARRYDRGLKTLQSLLSSVKKGKPINEEDIPPPVATGANPAPESQPEPIRRVERPSSEPAPAPPVNEKPLRDAPAPPSRPQLLTPPQKTLAVTPGTPLISPLTPSQPDTQHSEAKSLVLSRQREYKLAAIQAKQGGDTDLAKRHYLTAKRLDVVVEALDRGEPLDIGALPPPPGDAVAESPAPPTQRSSQPPAAAPAAPAAPPVADAALPAPRSVAEALQQRMDKYKAAADGAKSKGDDRKARMHLRIVKQYQDAIRAQKAGRPVNLSDLPVPPGCPPLQGAESGEQNFMGVLENAMKLANQDADAEEEDGPEEGVAKTAVRPVAQRAKAPAPSPETPPAPGQGSKLGPKAQQQLDFLQTRRQQFMRAALRSKQMKDMQGAALHLRHAKGLDPMISAAQGGLPVDITKVPSAPVSEEDYSLAQSRSSPLSPRTSEQYAQLMDHLRQQHEKCLGYSQQFTHMGNVAETTRFEKLAAECMQSIEILKKAHAKGYALPRFHTEERTFNAVKIYPDLTANELVLTIVKGINLPAPSGVSPNDLDASVRFEFPFPSSEDPQRDKTNTVKDTNCPEYKEKFKLNINRTHRGFKRVVQTKGIKFEVIHKGGLFKGDKVVGSAQLKLESLETQCEIRQLIEILDGRKPTGGRLEVRVKIREPLGGPQLHTVTERWLVLDPITEPPPKETTGRRREQGPPHKKEVSAPKSSPHNDHGKNSGRPPPQYKLHSFKLLSYDKERLDSKITEYKRSRRDVPPDLVQQHRELSHRLQWQSAQLERASPSLVSEYERVLQRLVQGLGEGVKKYSSQGNREAAKEALGRMRLVESEMESLRRRRTV
ncbi:coiled-coil and C2 domain-containing protein 1A [Anguilla anguilla]|uniref:coiled-coil and C2 domain-containing protein 1A n=1 Tax=Anguilla anguilla TaxID=7936 RepID=UPI0015A7AE77|nr:coiled-coil and C2 domain-containing protein 1A [Anguilla anguilla]